MCAFVCGVRCVAAPPNHHHPNLSNSGTLTNNGYYHTTDTPNLHHPSGSTTPSSSTPTTLKRINRFNPKLIFSQIVAIQSIHYLVLSFLFQINYVLFGTHITIDRVFTGRYLDLWTREVWIDNGAVLLSSVVG